MKKNIKTNAMRLLDQAKINYETLYYDLGDREFSGEVVSELLGVEPSDCFKTLVLKHEKALYVLVVSVNQNIDLKKSAKSIGVKNLEMVKVKDLMSEVGYERGSVTPIGIKKRHEVYFDVEINALDKLVISGGLKGVSLVVDKKTLLEYLNAKVVELC